MLETELDISLKHLAEYESYRKDLDSKSDLDSFAEKEKSVDHRIRVLNQAKAEIDQELIQIRYEIYGLP